METLYQFKQPASIWHAIWSILLTVFIFASLGCPGNPDEEIKGDSDILGDINLDLKAPTFGSLKQELAALRVRVSQPSETAGNTITYSDMVLASWGSGILIWADFPGNGKINDFGPTLKDDAHPVHVYINNRFKGTLCGENVPKVLKSRQACGAIVTVDSGGVGGSFICLTFI